jgi:hypothetical protein
VVLIARLASRASCYEAGEGERGYDMDRMKEVCFTATQACAAFMELYAQQGQMTMAAAGGMAAGSS